MIAHKYLSWKERVFFPFIPTKSPTALICTPFQVMPRNMMHNKYELQTCSPSYASRCLSFMCQICSFKMLLLTFQKSTSFPCCALWWRKSTAFGRHVSEKIRAISNQNFDQIQRLQVFSSKKKSSDNSGLFKYGRNIMINCNSEETGVPNKYFCCILQRQRYMPQDWWNTFLYWVRNMLASSFEVWHFKNQIQISEGF